MIHVRATQFTDAKIYVPEVHEDDRGFFKEVYSHDRYAEVGLNDDFVQDNISWSTRNVIRGLHYDLRMAKFVQCLRGRIFDVIVDMNEGSPAYKRWQGFYLTEHNHLQLYVPRGFAHGFLALSDEVMVMYKQTAHYDPAHERAVSWRDPSVGIVWPLVGEARLSPKDAAAAW